MVAKFEAKELQNTPLRIKFKQMLSIFKLGIGLTANNKQRSNQEAVAARHRWCLLKAGY